jgi:pyrroline-5-carboxylate reductase
MTIALKGRVVLVGCGNMGGAMLKGWLKAGVPPEKIVGLDPKPPQDMALFLAQHNIMMNPSLADIHDAQVVILAVKPQLMAQVLPGLLPLMAAKPVVLSIAAGKTIAGIEQALGSGTAVIRAMPNTPAAIGRGITGMVGNPHVSPEQFNLAEALLSSTGEVLRVKDEQAIDFVTAVSGSGPAYVFYLAECMAAAGEKLGLPTDLAMRLARATVSGSGELLQQSDLDAATLRQNVTSPNGTTYAALQVLMADDGLKPLLEKAIAAAAKRAGELAG